MRNDFSPPKRVVKRVLPYTCEQLFDMVADIERYPEFLSGLEEARIIERAGNQLRVRQQLDWPLLSQSFMSTAELERPSRLSIRSNDGPFRNLHIVWLFQPVEIEHCEVELEVSAELKSRILDRILGVFRGTAARDILSYFEDRACVLYGEQKNG